MTCKALPYDCRLGVMKQMYLSFKHYPKLLVVISLSAKNQPYFCAMKETFLVTLLSLASMATFAQTPMMGNRALTKSVKPYAALTSATIGTNAFDWDDPTVTIPLPFSFEMLNRNFVGNMYMTPDFSVAAFSNISTAPATNSSSFGLFSDVRNRNNADFPNAANNSEIRYRVDSTVGNRILKVEFSNVGFLDDNTNTAFANWQYWWHEADSAYEIHFGSSLVADTLIADSLYEGTLMFGAMKDFDVNATPPTLNKFYVVVDNPTLTIDSIGITQIIAENFKGVASWPTANTVWRFAYPKVGFPASTSEIIMHNNIEVNTSMTSGKLMFNISNLQEALSYTLYSSGGTKVSEGRCASGINSFDASKLASGVYILGISNANQTAVFKLMR
jgi:hypothetical protein